MSERLRFHLDEHVPHAVAVALRRHGIDVTTTPEAGLRQADDLTHLTFANLEGRVLVTHDADFLRYHAQGITHSGIAYRQKGARTVGSAINAPLLKSQEVIMICLKLWCLVQLAESKI